jgi:AbrB family looped-hinge helix DNA binding protein
MQGTTVTRKGQITIPKAVRQKLGIRAGSEVWIRVEGDHAVLTTVGARAEMPENGFGMLKSKRKSVPADFDVASLLAPK